MAISRHYNHDKVTYSIGPALKDNCCSINLAELFTNRNRRKIFFRQRKWPSIYD